MIESRNQGVRIYYETFGEKTSDEAVVFLCGIGSDHTIFLSQINYLKNSYYIIAIDHRGTGKSDAIHTPATARLLAEDVKSILDRECLDSINLVGFSLGGLAAQKFTDLYPHMVRRLVLMNCSMGSGNVDTVPPRKDVINMFLFFEALTQEDACKNSVYYHFGKAFETEHPEQYRDFLSCTIANSLSIPHLIPVLVSDDVLIEDYQKVTMPVMVILSTEDPVTPPGNGAAFKKYLPHAQIEYLDGHHASMVIHPGEVNRMLAGFISGR